MGYIKRYFIGEIYSKLESKSKELFCEVELTIKIKFNFIYTWEGLALVSSSSTTVKSCKKKHIFIRLDHQKVIWTLPCKI